MENIEASSCFSRVYILLGSSLGIHMNEGNILIVMHIERMHNTFICMQDH